MREVQYANEILPIFFTLSGNVIDVIPEQSKKAASHISVTVSGMTISPEQAVPSIRSPFTITRGFSFCLFLSHGVLQNALSLILVTLSGIVTDVRLLQL